jgi:hypothetical protein
MLVILNLIIIGRTLTWMGYALPAFTFFNLTFVLESNIYEPAPGWFGHVDYYKPWSVLTKKGDDDISIVYKILYIVFFIFTLTSLVPIIYYINAFKTAPHIADYPQWAQDHYSFVRTGDAGWL